MGGLCNGECTRYDSSSTIDVAWQLFDVAGGLCNGECTRYGSSSTIDVAWQLFLGAIDGERLFFDRIDGE